MEKRFGRFVEMVLVPCGAIGIRLVRRFPLVSAWPMVAVAAGVFGTCVAGHVPEVGVFVSAPAAGVLGADAATVGDMRRAVPVRTGVARQVFEGRVGLAAVLANPLLRRIPLEEDVLAAMVVRTCVAEKRLCIGVFLTAELAVNGCGLWRGFGFLPIRSGGKRHAAQTKHGSQQGNRDGDITG